MHVHIHDIFTPYDIRSDWVVGPAIDWGAVNEQYAQECLLSGGARYRVTLPLYLLGREHPEIARKLVPDLPDRGQSFWIVVESSTGRPTACTL